MLSYIGDIYPMFEEWAGCMIERNWHLDSVDFMCNPNAGQGFPDHFHARKTYVRLSTSNTVLKMPPGGPYLSSDQLALYRQWMEEGFQP